MAGQNTLYTTVPRERQHHLNRRSRRTQESLAKKAAEAEASHAARQARKAKKSAAASSTSSQQPGPEPGPGRGGDLGETMANIAMTMTVTEIVESFQDHAELKELINTHGEYLWHDVDEFSAAIAKFYMIWMKCDLQSCSDIWPDFPSFFKDASKSLLEEMQRGPLPGGPGSYRGTEFWRKIDEVVQRNRSRHAGAGDEKDADDDDAASSASEELQSNFVHLHTAQTDDE